MSFEERKQLAFEKGKTIPWIQCPMCAHMVPMNVKLDKDGNPLSKESEGIVFKKTDNGLVRRFAGPSVGFMPFQMRVMAGRLGTFTKVEDSRSTRTLKHVDQELYNDFKNALEKCRIEFSL